MLIELTVTNLHQSLLRYTRLTERTAEMIEIAEERQSQRINDFGVLHLVSQCGWAIDAYSRMQLAGQVSAADRRAVVPFLNKGLAAAGFIATQSTPDLPPAHKYGIACDFLDRTLLVFPDLLIGHAGYGQLWITAHSRLEQPFATAKLDFIRGYLDRALDHPRLDVPDFGKISGSVKGKTALIRTIAARP